MIKALSHVGITVKDLDRSLDFYSEILGFPVLKTKIDSQLKVVSATIQVGNFAVEIFKPTAQKPSAQKPVGIGMESVMEMIRGYTGLNHISLLVDNIDRTFEELRSKGVSFIVEPRLTSSGSKIAFLADPDGILVELVQRP